MILPPELTLAIAGLVFVISGMLMWRSSVQRQRIARRDPLKELKQEQAQKAQSPEAIIHDMEIRLFNYGREVEGRVETTLNVLDRLIIDAEQEIGRLEELLQTQQRQTALPTGIPAGGREIPTDLQRIPALLAAGLTDAEIARCLNCDVALVRQWRRDQHDGEETAAA